MSKYEFDDGYQVSIKYSCRYTLPQEEEDGTRVSIECVFKDFAPMMRMEVQTDYGYFADLTEEENSIYSPFADLFVNKVDLIVKDAYRVGRNPRTLSIREKFGYPEEYPRNVPVILGFATRIYLKPHDTEETIHQKVKELTKDIVAVLLHSPLFNAVMVQEPLKDWPSMPFDYLEFSETIPKRFMHYMDYPEEKADHDDEDNSNIEEVSEEEINEPRYLREKVSRVDRTNFKRIDYFSKKYDNYD